MKAILLLSLFISALTFNLRQAKQSFDSYVMAVQWANGYCSANSCGSKADHVEKNTFTIHGLWPSLKSGKQLSDCTSGVKIEDDGSALFSDMKQYWPSFAKSNEEFWEHEYNKHGFCMVEEYGWSGYEEYFDFVISLLLKTYKNLFIKVFPDKKTVTITYENLVKAIQNIIPSATLKINCKSNYLYEIYFYVEKDFSPSTNSRFSNTCQSAKIVFK
jgi:ribonuclease I